MKKDKSAKEKAYPTKQKTRYLLMKNYIRSENK